MNAKTNPHSEDDRDMEASTTTITTMDTKDIFNFPVTELPVLFDLRSSADYRDSHILGAVSVPIRELIERKISNDSHRDYHGKGEIEQQGSLSLVQSCHKQLQRIMSIVSQQRGYDSYNKVIIYFDEDISDRSENEGYLDEERNLSNKKNSMLSIEDLFVQSIVRYGLPMGITDDDTDIFFPRALFVYRRGYQQEFVPIFPFLVMKNTMLSLPMNEGDASNDVMSRFYPSMIDMKWGLFLGSFLHAKTEQVLIDLKIDVILNVTSECSNVFESTRHDDDDDLSSSSANASTTTSTEENTPSRRFQYHRFNVVDSCTQSMESTWFQAADILRTCKKNGQRVLVHCAKGASRSASTIIYYMMKYESYSMKQALRYLQSCRRIVNPNEGFIQQLVVFEGKLNGKVL
jgi:rhodanese-related sulfurtransferase/predicted protein tyrosine phosphatase